MRRFILFCALIAVTCQLSAQNFKEFKELQTKGLPANAIPAKHFFLNQFSPDEILRNFDLNSMDESSIIVPNAEGLGGIKQVYFFVVKQLSKADQEFDFIDLWVYEEGGRAYRAFHQDDNNYGDHMMLDIYFMKNVITRDSVYTDKSTKERITRHLKTGHPVVAMNAQEYNGTGHGIVSTLLVQCKTGKCKLLENQKPVSVLSPLTNMLMLAEWDLASDYLITTSSMVFGEYPYKESEEFTIFSHQHFTPTLYLYTPRGEEITSYELPSECIDMVR